MFAFIGGCLVPEAGKGMLGDARSLVCDFPVSLCTNQLALPMLSTVKC